MKRSQKMIRAARRPCQSLTLCICFLVLSPWAAPTQDCRDCDCYHFPISKNCETCCGLELGTITGFSKSKLELTTSHVEGKPIIRSFSLTAQTKMNADLKIGAFATVYYHREDDVARGVDLTEAVDGLIKPGDESDPSLPGVCKGQPSPNSLRIYAGNSVIWNDTNDVGILSVGGTRVLGVRRTINGLAVYATFFEKGGRIGAQVVDNRIYFDPAGTFQLRKPDAHTLVIADSATGAIFEIRFLNPHSVKMKGQYFTPSGMLLNITDNGMSLGRLQVGVLCAEDVGSMLGVR